MCLVPGSDVEALWLRLQAWSIDEPGAAQPFSVRLAADNGWDFEFAQRAIQEYKRFALLAVTTNEVMTPSDAVDQVWHLHLAYTKSYWEEFCPRILRYALHHQPSLGGPNEERRYRDTYAATLARYQRLFGHAPPSDLWPAPAQRFAERFRRVKVRRSSVLWRVGSQLARWWQAKYLRGFVAALPLISGCAGVFTSEMVNRPEAAVFLNFYLFLCLLATGLLLWLRLRLQAALPRMPMPRIDELSLYELAWLARGQDGVVQTVITHLFTSGQLSMGSGKGKGLFSCPTLGPSANRLEHAFKADLRAGMLPAGGGVALRAEIESLRLRLQERGLVPATEAWIRLRARTTWLVAGVLGIGIARVVYGLSHNRPVGYLLGLMCLFAVAAMFFYRRPLANATGQRLVRAAKAELAAGRSCSADARMLRAVAILGTGYLATSALADLRASLESVAASRTWKSTGGGGCGSGCGGGGCGGGGCGG